MGNGTQWCAWYNDAHHLLVSGLQNSARASLISFFSFCIHDIAEITGEDVGDFPIIAVIQRATGSYAATIVLGTLLIVLLFFSTVTTVASASRQIWAFSRDQVCDDLAVRASNANTPRRDFHSLHGFDRLRQNMRFL